MTWSKAKQKEYASKHYQLNKAEKLARAKARREAMTEEERRADAAKKAAWTKANRKKLNANKRALQPVIRARTEKLREESGVIGPTKAAAMLNLSVESFRRWVYAGRVPATKLPNGRYLLQRADIEKLRDAQSAGSVNVVRIGSSNKGRFVVPEGFDLITSYQELREYTEGFAAGTIPFLLLLGSPGSGKSRQMKSDLAGRARWIDNHVTMLGLYCSVFEAKGMPIVLDDVNHLLKTPSACSLVKSLTQTDDVKHISWESTAKALEEREVPREFETTSHLCLIANTWNMKDADMAAIQDRSMPVAFAPSAQTIHERVIELGWCDREIVQFVGDNLDRIPMPSMREYWNAVQYRRSKMDWRKKLLSIWTGQEAA